MERDSGEADEDASGSGLDGTLAFTLLDSHCCNLTSMKNEELQW